MKTLEHDPYFIEDLARAAWEDSWASKADHINKSDLTPNQRRFLSHLQDKGAVSPETGIWSEGGFQARWDMERAGFVACGRAKWKGYYLTAVGQEFARRHNGNHGSEVECDT